MENQQQNKFLNALCSDNFDPGKAICDLTGHKAVEIKKPDLTEKELAKLEKEASQPTIEDKRESLEKDIEEVKGILYKLQLKLLKL